MKFRVRVNRLVVSGAALTERDQPLLREAAQQELLRLLAAEGLEPEPAQLRQLRVRASIGPSSTPPDLGQEIARAVHGVVAR